MIETGHNSFGFMVVNVKPRYLINRGFYVNEFQGKNCSMYYCVV